jgi:hypothetical protein
MQAVKVHECQHVIYRFIHMVSSSNKVVRLTSFKTSNSISSLGSDSTFGCV